MEFTDMHIHALYGVDDGPKTKEEMLRMVELSYLDGVRTMWLTPHFHPGYFGDNRADAEAAFAVLKEYAQAHWPNLQLFLGNELRYSPGCIGWLDDGWCRTMDQDRHVLVDFFSDDSREYITAGLTQLLSAGYTPILAHAERYKNLRGDLQALRSLCRKGALLQVTAGALTGGFGSVTRFYARRLVQERLVSCVGSDAHDISRRAPGLSEAYRYLERRLGQPTAKSLCDTGARMKLRNMKESGE